MLEKLLKRDFAEHEAFFTASGTCALFLILKAIAKKRGVGEAILPSTICASVVLSVLKAGFKPVFCDVELNTFCLSAATLKSALTKDTKAVLVAYMFGRPIDLEPIEKLATAHNFEIIEDIAQAIGGRRGSEALGARANFTLLSFNPKKIIGKTPRGAVLAKETDGLRAVREESKLLPVQGPNELTDSLAVGFRDFTMGLFADCRHANLKLKISPDKKILETFYDAFFFKTEWGSELSVAIGKEYAGLEDNRRRRFKKYELFDKYLSPDIHRAQFEESDMIWRMPILSKTYVQQRKALADLRAAGVLVSDHYFPMSVFMGGAECAVANEIGMRILNLWVDDSADESKIPWICESLNHIIVNEK